MLFELLAKRKIEPVVAERIPLAEARCAHENLGRSGITGKQVLMCDESSRGENAHRFQPSATSRAALSLLPDIPRCVFA